MMTTTIGGAGGMAAAGGGGASDGTLACTGPETHSFQQSIGRERLQAKLSNDMFALTADKAFGRHCAIAEVRACCAPQ